VELAVCLPVLTLLFMATFDMIDVMRSNQALVEATHELARVFAATDSDATRVNLFLSRVLTQKQLHQAQLTVDPPSSHLLARGTPITVQLSIPVTANCLNITGLFTGRTLSTSSTVSRELGPAPTAERLPISAPPAPGKPPNTPSKGPKK
jgi:hypothetical protein